MKAYLSAGLILGALVTACATVPLLAPPLNQNIDWQIRRQQLELLKTWKIHGAIALQQGSQAENFSFYWVENEKNYRLEIYGPLGIGRQVLTVQGQHATLKNATGNVVTAASAEILLQQFSAWTLPVSSLHYWLRGLPAPLPPQTTNFDTYHHLLRLQQQGWSIRYISYLSFQGRDLPHKIIFQYRQLRGVVLINQWELG